MPWTTKPQATWGDREKLYFSIEIATRIKFDSVSVAAGTVTAGTTKTVTVTSTDTAAVTGLRVGMAVGVTPPADIPDGIAVSACVGVTDTLSVRLVNATAGDIVVGTGTWAFFGIVL